MVLGHDRNTIIKISPLLFLLFFKSAWFSTALYMFPLVSFFILIHKFIFMVIIYAINYFLFCTYYYLVVTILILIFNLILKVITNCYFKYKRFCWSKQSVFVADSEYKCRCQRCSSGLVCCVAGSIPNFQT